MNEPRLEFLPLRPALPAARVADLTLLIRVHPAPAPSRAARRSPLNLALVIDRSGSMSGHPLQMARQAAVAAVRQAHPEDRLSVVAFDDRVEVVVPSGSVTDRDAVIRAIGGIEDRGSTNLHGGWLEGATQVARHLDPGSLNRVILLSDGQANVGMTDRREIAGHVRGLTERGISTTAIGLGAHYDEELLLGMANAGDGNFEHVEDPARLPTLFEEELLGLTRTSGRMVSLGLEPNPEFGVEVRDVHNDFARNGFGRLQLPNLVEGQPVDVVVSLAVPSREPGQKIGVLRARLAWTGTGGVRRRVRVQLDLPVVTPDEYDRMPEDPAVLEAVALLQAARYKREAAQAMDRGDRAGARDLFTRAGQVAFAVPAPSPALAQELEDVRSLTDALDAGDDALSRKRAVSQAHDRTRGKRRR